MSVDSTGGETNGNVGSPCIGLSLKISSLLFLLYCLVIPLFII